MKTLELEEFGTIEINFDEREKTNGGNPILIGIGIGIGVMVVYDFICGFYTGVKQAL